MTNELISQYRASLKMLRDVMAKCPDGLWVDSSYASPYWQIVYHTLYYTHLYLVDNEGNFIRWKRHKAEYHRLDLPIANDNYTKAEMDAYAADIGHMAGAQIEAQDLKGPSGCEWLAMNKFELHLYNLRHLHHHIGQLVERLHQNNISGINWVRAVD